jgi:cobalt-zinc-cadmium efflux system outer membrane protein
MSFRLIARARWAACGVLLAGGLSVAHATPSFSPAPAPLAEALRAAWARHPAAAATEQTIAAARARADAAGRPIYNPELELDIEDEGADRTSTLGLAWTLDWSGKRRARAEGGQAEFTLAEAEAALRRSSFALAWLQAWSDHLAATQRVRLGEQRIVLVQRFAALADRQLTVGDISSLERDLALLARDEAQAEQATLFSEAASAEESLRALGADGDLVQAPLPSGPPPAWDDAPMSAIGTTPEARVAAAMAASAERRITIAERDRRPDPTLSLRAGRLDFGPTSDNVIGMSVSVPLFVRNNFRAEEVAARADAGAAEAELRRIELEVRARAERMTRTYTAVRTAWNQWSKSPGTDVDKRADLLERLWRAGEISTSDYLIQLKQSLDTALAGADLQGRLWRSYVDALYATGRLDAWVGFDRSISEVTP